jgi:hypothetical protein
MTGKELPCLGIAGDCRVAHVHHCILDIGVPQPVLYKGDIRAGVQQMHRNRVAQRMKPPLAACRRNHQGARLSICQRMQPLQIES